MQYAMHGPAPAPDLGEALDQQRTETSMPVGATAPGNDPHGLGGLRAGDHAAVEPLVETD